MKAVGVMIAVLVFVAAVAAYVGSAGSEASVEGFGGAAISWIGGAVEDVLRAIAEAQDLGGAMGWAPK